jgi:hypothetical protein
MDFYLPSFIKNVMGKQIQSQSLKPNLIKLLVDIHHYHSIQMMFILLIIDMNHLFFH